MCPLRSWLVQLHLSLRIPKVMRLVPQITAASLYLVFQPSCLKSLFKWKPIISSVRMSSNLVLRVRRVPLTPSLLFSQLSTTSTKRGSKVVVAFLDCTKAFNRISHHGLFSKLIEPRVPLCILMCLVYWYSNMSCSVRWGAKSSQSFSIPLGIKQGGINSPELFSCYFTIVQWTRTIRTGCG